MPTTLSSPVWLCQPRSEPAATFLSAPYAPFVGSPQSVAIEKPFMAGLDVHLMSPAPQTTGVLPPPAADRVRAVINPKRASGVTRASAFIRCILPFVYRTIFRESYIGGP